VIQGQGTNLFFLLMNEDPSLTSGTMSNPLVQNAVRYALDYDGINALVGGPAATPSSILPLGFLGAYGTDHAFWRDLAMAQSLLAQAGFPNGFNIDLQYPTNFANSGVSFDIVAQKIQSDLGEAGIAAALGPGLEHTMIALVAVSWPRYARVTRGLVLSVKENEYVHASRALGASESHLLTRVVLPNCLAPALVMATLDLGNAILTFSGLSFLGLGSPPPAPEWGAMIAAGTQTFDQWWVSAFPGLAILTLVMAFNFIGDGVRDALDPRLRRSL
jgi:hypothetical protein